MSTAARLQQDAGNGRQVVGQACSMNLPRAEIGTGSRLNMPSGLCRQKAKYAVSPNIKDQKEAIVWTLCRKDESSHCLRVEEHKSLLEQCLDIPCIHSYGGVACQHPSSCGSQFKSTTNRTGGRVVSHYHLSDYHLSEPY